MRKIKINRIWSGKAGRFHPGVYLIPAEISALEARCCELDDAGYCFNEAEKAENTDPKADKPAAGRGRRKSAAPENKVRGAAPKNKADLEGSDGGGGGDGPVSNA